MDVSGNTKSLLSSQARIQAPWIKVTIGSYTFGVFSKSKAKQKDDNNFYTAFNIQYPNYVKSLTIKKVNGQVNTYSLNIIYPVKTGDDPNFFEKVFSSVSSSRKIIFSYGDSSMPTYCYKDEEAIITDVSTNFNLSGSNASPSLSYTITAISSATLGKTGSFTFMNSGKKKPSDEIKRVFKDTRYGLRALFTGMTNANLDKLIAADDKAVKLDCKTNISPLDYISYLAGCMVPAGSDENSTSKDIYILTIHDDTTYDKLYDGYDNSFASLNNINGPYFKIERSSYNISHSDAYEIEIGTKTSSIVTSFNVKTSNYSMYYDYSGELYPEEYIRRINNKGEWEDVYAPTFVSKNSQRKMRAEDVSWFTKITKYPISASITIQGLLRPATLMQYVRLNVYFPGGGKHISSGLYIVTAQTDSISESGYRTTLELTRIDGATI